MGFLQGKTLVIVCHACPKKSLSRELKFLSSEPSQPDKYSLNDPHKSSQLYFQTLDGVCKIKSHSINFPGGCVNCLLRALIEGHLSALASVAKTEKYPIWPTFY